MARLPPHPPVRANAFPRHFDALLADATSPVELSEADTPQLTCWEARLLRVMNGLRVGLVAQQRYKAADWTRRGSLSGAKRREIN